MHKSERKPSSGTHSFHMRLRPGPLEASLPITGDSHTDRGLLALTSIISEIAATAKDRIPEPLSSASIPESPQCDGKQHAHRE
jgi:hypothetical protein